MILHLIKNFLKKNRPGTMSWSKIKLPKILLNRSKKNNKFNILAKKIRFLSSLN